MTCCPNCGQKIQRPFGLDLPPWQLDVLAALIAKSPLTTDELTAAVYGDRRDGGPLHVAQVLCLARGYINERLPAGIRIVSSGNRGKRTLYWLEGS